MSNKEIEKQAEELIEKHLKADRRSLEKSVQTLKLSTWYKPKEWYQTYDVELAIKAAIVSCEFAEDRYFKKFETNGPLGVTYIKIADIKAYLEGLL